VCAMQCLPGTAWSLSQPLCWTENHCTCCPKDTVCIKCKYIAGGATQQKKFVLNIRYDRTHFFHWIFQTPNNSRAEGPMFARYFMCNFQDGKFSVRRGCLECHPFKSGYIKLRALSFITIRISCFSCPFFVTFLSYQLRFLQVWGYCN